MKVVQGLVDGRDLTEQRGTPRSNSDHSIKHRRSRAVSDEVAARLDRSRDSLKMGGTVATVLHLLRGFFLRLRIDVGNLFRLPWGGSRRRWRLAMVRQFVPSLASTSASSSAPPVKMKAPKGAVVFSDPS
jgi:hypothetical protein